MTSIPVALASPARLAPQETTRHLAGHDASPPPGEESGPSDDADRLLGYEGDPFSFYDVQVSDPWPLEWDFSCDRAGDLDLLGDIDPLEGCCDDGL